MVTFTNNTLTTADLMTLSCTGTRTSNYALTIADGNTTADTIGVTANALTTGSLLYLDSDRFQAGSPAGFYIECYDGDSADFTVGDEGKTVIDGVASTDVLTITAGDIQITAGDIDLDDGFVAINNDADEANNITRNFNGGGTNPVLTVKEDHTASTNVALLVENDGTGNSTCLQLSHDGDLPVIDIDAGAARTGDVINILMTNQVAEKAIAISGAMTGTAGEGVVEVHSTGNIASTATLLRLDADTGTPAGTQGFCMYVDDDTLAQAGAYAVEINSNANEGLNVSAGLSTFAELTNHTGGINCDAGFDWDTVTNDIGVNVESTATGNTAGFGVVTVHGNHAGGTNTNYLYRGVYQGNGDAQDGFLLFQDNSTGVAGNGDAMLTVGADGDVTMGGASGTGGRLIYSYEDLTIDTAGTAASVEVVTTFITTDGDANEDNATLADGINGQVKIFVIQAEGAGGDTWKITPTNLNGGSKISFDGVIGDGCTMIFDGTNWNIISNNGGTIS
jgi:hypothetical protein